MSKSDQKLPKERASPVHDPLDITEPVEGYLTVKQVIQVLDSYRLKPTEQDAAVLAKEYKIDPVDTGNLLKYFGNYYVRPEESKEKYELKYHPLHR